MAKCFSDAINEIMPLVRDGDTSTPFIISRSNDGGWQVNYPYPAENTAEIFVNQLKHDSCAVMFTGRDFSDGSFPYVYDKVLCGRLRAELSVGIASGDYPVWADRKEANAMLNFFEDRIGEFSHKLTDYLTTVDKPLAEFADMCPYKMVTDNDEWAFDENLAFDAVHYIENEVNDRLGSYPAENETTPRYINGYEEKQSVQIGKTTVVLAENLNAELPYLVCGRENGEDNNLSEFPAYPPAIREFMERQTALVGVLEAEWESLKERGVDSTVLTAEYCLPDSKNADFTNQLIVVDSASLLPEYRSSASQLIECTHGNGARPDAIGRSVFGKELYSGAAIVYDRSNVLGIADEDKLPQWAKAKLEIQRDPAVFEFGGYHFKPYRQFHKGEIDKPLKGDSRPRKKDVAYALRNMSSDFALGISAYDWNKTDVKYSHAAFYEAAKDSEADIFKCLENGNLYVPCANELFKYSEPPQKEQARANRRVEEKPDFLAKINGNKQKVEQNKAADTGVPVKKKKRDGQEV